MSEARIDRIANENNTSGPVLSGITTFSGQNYFVPPRGTTAERPSNCPMGSIRFNTDSAHLEYYDGLQWLELEAFNVELGVNGALGNRGIVLGGGPPTNNIEYVTISTLGNGQDFGDLTESVDNRSSFSSSVRGVNGGGEISPLLSNTIDYITISSTGDAQDFGDLSLARRAFASCSSSTRGLWSGGMTPTRLNLIEYVTIASTGNAQDFGDLISGLQRDNTACSSSTRGIIWGGSVSSPGRTNHIDYVTIASIGNSINFGDLTSANTGEIQSSLSNSTRGILSGSYSGVNAICFITISSEGNAQDFGDMTVTRYSHSSTSSPTRGIFLGGNSTAGGPVINNIDYISISVTGNAIDFGDLSLSRNSKEGCFSNGHGGL